MMEADPRAKQIEHEARQRLETRDEKDDRRFRDYTYLGTTPAQFLALTGRDYEYPGQTLKGQGENFTEAMEKFMSKVDEEIDINPPPIAVHVYAMEKCMRDLKGRKVIPATTTHVTFEQFVAWLYRSTFPE